jgi:hypothetical protein
MEIHEERLIREDHFRELRWSLQALATTDSLQPALFPEQSMSADELALDFDNSSSIVRERYEPDLSREQAAALDAIDHKLTTMSRDGAEFDAELWTDAAVRTSEPWREIRRLAAAALEAFGWPVESPPPPLDDERTDTAGGR